jgi:uncharacterized phage protein (TIGR01671 family)
MLLRKESSVLRKREMKNNRRYAGITDKNGTPIYEGDIVNATVWSNGDLLEFTAVVQDTGSGLFLKGISSPVAHSICGISKTRSEVIGNIYDNPEYLPPYKRHFIKSVVI